MSPKIDEMSLKFDEVSLKAEEMSLKVDEMSPKFDEMSPKVVEMFFKYKMPHKAREETRNEEGTLSSQLAHKSKDCGGEYVRRSQKILFVLHVRKKKAKWYDFLVCLFAKQNWAYLNAALSRALRLSCARLCSLCMCSKTTSKIQCVIIKNIYEACSLAPCNIEL